MKFPFHQVLENLQNTWLNEKFAPELLPQQSDMLDLMLGQIHHMEENIAQLDKNDFRYIAHQMELERIKYVATSYLRCRIKKIETFTRAILQNDSKRDPEQQRLSENEKIYADNYIALMRKHFHQIAIQHMPQNVQKETDREIVTPNVGAHVFLRANESVPSVIVGANNEEVDLEEGSLHIMAYNLASDLVIDGKVQLI